ncbi:MAG: hypothetical protein IJ986_02035 [Bacteroidales bacterium]|nr:hypothetical protein [Bacteroidales bacterium]MDD6582928.1 hypothetical protein [Bacteroidales bacterium]
MKKVFLALLVAGLFVACGNKNTEAENTDSTAMDSVVVEEPVVEAPAVEAEPVAEVQTPAPAEKEQTVGQVAKEEGDKLAKEAIKAGAQAGSNELKNVAKQSQTR